MLCHSNMERWTSTHGKGRSSGKGRGSGKGKGAGKGKGSANNSNKALVIEVNKRIVVLGRERKLEQARACLVELRGRGLKPTEITYNVLINASAKCGDNEGAASLLSEMQADGLRPSVVTFTTVVKGLCLSGQLQLAEDMMTRAEDLGVELNVRTCSAFLRGCLVWGEVDRVIPLVNRMSERWGLVLDSASAEYACRALCSGLRVEEAERLLQPQLPSRPRGDLARGEATTSEEATTCACHLAFATAYCALLDAPRALARLELAEARLGDGLDTRLYSDRDEDDDGQLAAFLQHRQNELRLEVERLRATVTALCSVRDEREEPRSKRRRVEHTPGGPGEGSGGEGTMLGTHLQCMEAVYGRLLLVSEATVRLATAPLGEHAAYGMAPKALRRFRLAALLVTRLERLGLPELQRRCSGALGLSATRETATRENTSSTDDGTAASAQAEDGEALVAESEARMIKRMKKACNAQCHIRWPIVFGNDAPTCLEICAGGGEWAYGQASTYPDVNWVASEIRGDRIGQIFDRMRTSRLTNLACLGGDAAVALKHHTRPNAFDAIWVTFPEPPADHSDPDTYLLNGAFFRDAFAALSPAGRGLFIVTDNLTLLESVCETLYALWDAQALPFVAKSGADSGRPRVQAWVQSTAGRRLISEGMPADFGELGGTSYFDRLWASRAKQRRFHISIGKP